MKKLIEVALPLDDINKEAAREKSIRHGHPSTLHLWWARRPLAAARAVLFSQMVNDPGGERGWKSGKTKAQADAERETLFDIIRDLVKWENSNNEEVLERARAEIKKSWIETCAANRGKPGYNPEILPGFHDPFAGGGALPIEAQRLGLESYASDLNPVAVLLNKAMIEVPPKFANVSPIGPIPETDKQDKKRSTPDMHETWPGSKGLAEDVRRYGAWIKKKGWEKIGHLYPKFEITNEIIDSNPGINATVGESLNVIAFIWTRTVKSPSPAYSHVDVPLVRSFKLSTKKGKEVWVEPVINDKGYEFEVRRSGVPGITGTVARTGGTCIMSGTAIPFSYIREEGKAGRIKYKLMAVVADGKKGRVYLPPTQEMVDSANSAKPEWKPVNSIPMNPRDFKTPNYGMDSFGDLFTNRQLVALTTFSDLVSEARDHAIGAAKAAGMKDDSLSLESGGSGATAYGDAIALYLGMAVSRTSNTLNALAVWSQGREQSVNLFSRQAIPMNWDFPEVNPFAGAAGDFSTTTASMAKSIAGAPAIGKGFVIQHDAQTQAISNNKVISTDPPYYDNIGYADLSDFFYVWMRKSIRSIYPSLFGTMAVPKSEELVATPYRHGGKEEAESFFMDGMTLAIKRLAEESHPSFPVSIYYAFKQSETKDTGTVSTGWETFLEAVLRAGFTIVGTWPMRTERPTGVKVSMNALASSIILVCRKRDGSEAISRRQFQRELREEMPEALNAMVGGSTGQSPIAPVDLAQSAIGPGMAIFSKYESVLNQDGSKMNVHDALILINRAISEYLNPESGVFDEDTLFCDDWFEQYGWGEGPFGEADTLARAKGTSVNGVAGAGVIKSGGGKVRLLKWEDYPSDWDPKSDNRTPIWEACHHMIRTLTLGGEEAAGRLLARMPERGEPIRQLAYHLYTLCERKKWAEEARAYNEMITAWHAIVAASHEAGHKDEQIGLEF